MNVIRFTDLVAQGRVAGQRVFIRADLNVPQDDAGRITEDTRIRARVPCIRMALDAGAAVMVTSHLGRPTEGAFKPDDSLAPVAARLGELLGREVPLVADWVDGVDVAPGAGGAARELPRQQGREEERRGAGAQDGRAVRHLRQRRLRHRAPRRGHAPTASRSSRRSPAPARCWPPRSTPSRKALAQPKRPLVAIVAGSKVSTKLTILKALADKVDQLIVGGGIANTFMLAAGLPIGKRLAEPDLVDEARAVIEAMKARGADGADPDRRGDGQDLRRRRRRPSSRPAADVADDDLILDIGPKTAARLAAQLRAGRHHRLERPGRRVRVRRLRARHRDASRAPSPRARRSASPAAATRWRRSPSTASRTRSATSRPAAAPSWRCWRARRCRRFEILEERAAGAAVIGLTPLPAVEHVDDRPPARPRGRRAMRRRATKIVATLGPASSVARGARADDPRRRRRGAAQLHRTARAQDHIDRAALVREAARSAPAARSRSWPTCRARRSASASSRDGKVLLEPAQRSSSSTPSRTELGDASSASASTTRSCRAT